MIATYSKTKLKKFTYKKIQNDIKAIESNYSSKDIQIEVLSNDAVFKGNEIIFDAQKVNVDFKNTLGEFYDLWQGVVEASNKVSSKQLKKINKPGFQAGDGIFVINNIERAKLNLNSDESDVLKKYLDPNDVVKWGIKSPRDKWLIYSDGLIKKNISSNSKFLNLKKHLDKYSDFITSSNRPYGLHRPREKRFFEEKKIIFIEMFDKNEFAIDSNKYYIGKSFISVLQKASGYSLEYLLGLLNSRYARHWFNTYGKRRGAGVDVGVEKLRSFPLPDNYSKKIEEKVMEILSSSPDKLHKLEEELDTIIYKSYGLRR